MVAQWLFLQRTHLSPGRLLAGLAAGLSEPELWFGRVGVWRFGWPAVGLPRKIGLGLLDTTTLYIPGEATLEILSVLFL